MTLPPLSLPLASEDATQILAEAFARLIAPGDTLALNGPIGAGKSFFARALIRHRAGALIDVPSPTFTLVQTYDLPSGEIWHADLYRLTSPEEVLELGLDDAFVTAICLIEWPDRLGTLLPQTALSLQFQATDTAHHLTISDAPLAWAERLSLLRAGLSDV